MAAMTMPVRSVRVRAGIVELPCIVTKRSPARFRRCTGVDARACINDCVSNQLRGTIVTSAWVLPESPRVLY